MSWNSTLGLIALIALSLPLIFMVALRLAAYKTFPALLFGLLFTFVYNLLNIGFIEVPDRVITTLNFWNANGLADATRLGGGSGTWSLTASNWTDEQGTLTASMQPVPGFAIFGGDAGTVTIDNVGGAVSATVGGVTSTTTVATFEGSPSQPEASTARTR